MTVDTRYYRIADITIKVESDLPITDSTFDRKFVTFRVTRPNEDTISISHHFKLPDLSRVELGEKRYQKAPWTIYQQRDGWLYVGFLPKDPENKCWKIAQFNKDHTKGQIYHPNPEAWQQGGFGALTTFPTDQILLARVLGDRQGFFLHSAGAILNGQGVLFVGHSEAGKSTITQMLLDAEESIKRISGDYDLVILCDDRNIVRKKLDGWRVYGSWSHGDIPNISAESAPLQAICFLEQASTNKLIPLNKNSDIYHRLLACLIKPFVTADWWDKTLRLVENFGAEVPCYRMQFDKSGAILDSLIRIFD